MIGTTSSERRLTSSPRFLLLSAVVIAAACAGMGAAGKRSTAVLGDGTLTPSLPPATSVGGPVSPCANNPVLDEVLSSASKAGARIEPDARLCAEAESLLGWNEKAGAPPEPVMKFLASYFGLPQVTSFVSIPPPLESDDPRSVADSLAETVISFAKQASHPRIGVSSQRVKAPTAENSATRTRADARASVITWTKVALLMSDDALELQPLPRQMAAGSDGQLTGRFLVPVQQAEALVCGADGKLTEAKVQGSDFQIPVHCGDKAGLSVVELRGQERGISRSFSSFSIACGGAELPKSVQLPKPEGAAQTVPAEEQVLFDAINADRQKAGLPVLKADAAMAEVARGIANTYRDEYLKAGTLTGISPEAKLRAAGVSYAEVVQNPALAFSAEDAVARFATSARDRCNYLNPTVTGAGMGVAPFTDNKGHKLVVAVELLGRELKKIDPVQARQELKDAIAKRRSDSNMVALTVDARLDKAAQEYADELAAAHGKLANSKVNHIITPLRKVFLKINIVEAAKADVNEIAQDQSIVGEGKAIGVGVATGESANLGKNTAFAVVLIANKR